MNTQTDLEPESAFSSQRLLVWQAVEDGAWHLLADLATRLNLPEQSVSARLRDFRKARYGGHRVDRRRESRGVYAYRVVRENAESPE